MPEAAPADEGEDSYDEEYYLKKAMELSLAEQDPAAAQAQAQPAAPAEEAANANMKEDIKDIVATDFMRDLVDQLGLDVGNEGLGDLMGEEEKKEEEKKEEEKKDGDGAQ